MANYSTLKAAINQYIKTNGNKEITGTVLNSVLTAMIDSLGANYTFSGIATPSTNPGTPDQNVFYLATQGGTYTNFGATALPEGISLLMWNGSWTAQTIMYNDGGVFDISVFKSTGGTLATFADLSAALGTGGANIPEAARKGGMSIKFVSSSDNKYVQYRLMADEFSTNTDDWAIADDDVYIENPEYNYIITDRNKKVVFGIKLDGSIEWSIGVPKPIKDYISNILQGSEDNIIDGLDKVIAFLNNITIPFNGAKVSILGDSISTFDQKGYKIDGYDMYYPRDGVTSVNDTWWMRFINDTGSIFEVNASDGGSTASTYDIGFSARVPLLGAPDIIFVELGTNDSIHNVEIGEFDFDAEEYDLTKFAPAYIKGMKDLTAAYPNARIVCTAFYMNEEYARTIRTIAEHYNAVYIDVRGAYSGLHPNNAGMQSVFNVISEYYTNIFNLETYISVKADTAKLREKTENFEQIEDKEYLSVTLDSHKRILDGIKQDGTKVINIPVEILGCRIDNIDNKEFIEIETDFNKKILSATTKSGKRFYTPVSFEGKIELKDIKLSSNAQKYIKTLINGEIIDISDGTVINNALHETTCCGATAAFDPKTGIVAVIGSSTWLEYGERFGKSQLILFNIAQPNDRKYVIFDERGQEHEVYNPWTGETETFVSPGYGATVNIFSMGNGVFRLLCRDGGGNNASWMWRDYDYVNDTLSGLTYCELLYGGGHKKFNEFTVSPFLTEHGIDINDPTISTHYFEFMSHTQPFDVGNNVFERYNMYMGNNTYPILCKSKDNFETIELIDVFDVRTGDYEGGFCIQNNTISLILRSHAEDFCGYILAKKIVGGSTWSTKILPTRCTNRPRLSVYNGQIIVGYGLLNDEGKIRRRFIFQYGTDILNMKDLYVVDDIWGLVSPDYLIVHDAFYITWCDAQSGINLENGDTDRHRQDMRNCIKFKLVDKNVKL